LQKKQQITRKKFLKISFKTFSSAPKFFWREFFFLSHSNPIRLKLASTKIVCIVFFQGVGEGMREGVGPRRNVSDTAARPQKVQLNGTLDTLALVFC